MLFKVVMKRNQFFMRIYETDNINEALQQFRDWFMDGHPTVSLYYIRGD